MRHSGFLVLALAASCMVSAPEDEGLSEAEQAEEWNGGPDDPEGEVIVVEGETDWPDWWFPGPDTVPDPGDTGGGTGGGGPGPGTGPKPARRDCQAEKGEFGEAVCHACCAWNHDNVDAPACNEVIFAILRQACFQAALATEIACNTMCREPDEGILTNGGEP